jgi:hypothetical protein
MYVSCVEYLQCRSRNAMANAAESALSRVMMRQQESRCQRLV